MHILYFLGDKGSFTEKTLANSTEDATKNKKSAELPGQDVLKLEIPQVEPNGGISQLIAQDLIPDSDNLVNMDIQNNIKDSETVTDVVELAAKNRTGSNHVANEDIQNDIKASEEQTVTNVVELAAKHRTGSNHLAKEDIQNDIKASEEQTVTNVVELASKNRTGSNHLANEDIQNDIKASEEQTVTNVVELAAKNRTGSNHLAKEDIQNDIKASEEQTVTNVVELAAKNRTGSNHVANEDIQKSVRYVQQPSLKLPNELHVKPNNHILQLPEKKTIKNISPSPVQIQADSDNVAVTDIQIIRDVSAKQQEVTSEVQENNRIVDDSTQKFLRQLMIKHKVTSSDNQTRCTTVRNPIVIKPLTTNKYKAVQNKPRMTMNYLERNIMKTKEPSEIQPDSTTGFSQYFL